MTMTACPGRRGDTFWSPAVRLCLPSHRSPAHGSTTRGAWSGVTTTVIESLLRARGWSKGSVCLGSRRLHIDP